MGQLLIQEIFEKIYSVVKIGAISVASSLSTLGLISSGSAALFGFKFRRSLAMPSQVMVISGIVWYFDFTDNLQLDSNSLSVILSIFENTDLNWSFKTFALGMGSVINLPSCFNDEIPWWSLFFMFDIGPKLSDRLKCSFSFLWCDNSLDILPIALS